MMRQKPFKHASPGGLKAMRELHLHILNRFKTKHGANAITDRIIKEMDKEEE